MPVQTLSSGPTPVWSNKSLAPNAGLFHYLTDFVDAAQVKDVRMSFELRANSGSAEILVGYEVANVETDPLQTFAIGAIYSSATGWTYGSSFTDIQANLANRQLVRFGVFVRNANGTSLEAALVTLRVDVRGCD
jgi:hypothetical protein